MRKHALIHGMLLLAMMAMIVVSVPTPQAAAQVTYRTCDQVNHPKTECESLWAFFLATGGPNWTNNQNWFLSEWPTNWRGLEVRNSRVTKIELSNNNLIGTLPPEIGNFQRLIKMDVSRNQLSGAIPTEIGGTVKNPDGMRDVQILNLSFNQLSGDVPVGITRLNNLLPPVPGPAGLALDNNNLNVPAAPEVEAFLQTKDPDWSLTQGYCENTITEIPAGECRGLLAVYDGLRGANWKNKTNWLATTTPSDWYGVTVEGGHVTRLNLSNNNAVGPIPGQINLLTSLVELDLSLNPIGGAIPAQIGDLITLNVLNLADARLMGSVPSSITKLVNLYDDPHTPPGLSLDRNNLTVPAAPAVETFLQQKDPDWAASQGFCQLVTQVSQNDCQALLSFYGATNGNGWMNRTNWLVSTTISSWYGVSVSGGRVTALRLGNNQLAGVLPADVGNLDGLRVLEVSHNNLSGSLPDSLTKLTRLVSGGLLLDYNQFAIPLPYPSDPPTALQTFLMQRNPDWYLTQGQVLWDISKYGGEYTSGDGAAKLVVPSGALTEAITITYTNPNAAVIEVNGKLVGNPRFTLEATGLSSKKVTTLNQPAVLTITYSDAAVGQWSEELLLIYAYDTAQNKWVDAATTCAQPNPVYTRDPAQNLLAVNVCRFGEFALVVEPAVAPPTITPTPTVTVTVTATPPTPTITPTPTATTSPQPALSNVIVLPVIFGR